MATIVRNAHARRLAPGLCEQHAADCLKSIAWPRARCTCTPTYGAWIRHDGGVTRSTHATRAGADAWLATALDARRRERAATVPTLGSAVAGFLARVDAGVVVKHSGAPYQSLTASFYRRALEGHVLAHRDRLGTARLGDRPLHAIDATALHSAVEALLETSGSATALTTCCALRALFRDLVERGDLELAPTVPSLPDTRVAARRRAYTPVEIERVLVAAHHDDERLKRSLVEPLVVLMLGSGASVRAAVRVTWGKDGLDLDARQPRVQFSRPRADDTTAVSVVGLTPAVAAVLREHHARLGSPASGTPVFPAQRGDDAVHVGLAYAALRRVAKDAGIKNLSPLALRATSAAHAATTMAPTKPEEARP